MNPGTFVHVALVLAALVVMAEALNKLERCAPLRPGLTVRERLVDWLKALAWALLALCSGGAIVSPTMSILSAAVVFCFAALIVSNRVKESME